MGASKSGAELVGKLVHASENVEEATRIGIARSALFIKTAVVGELRGVTRLRGVGKKGAKIGVRYDVLSSGKAATVRMTGPAQLIEGDTKAHDIKPKGKHKAIRLATGDVRAAVFHPGTHGKHPFAKGVAVATPKMPAVMLDEQAKALKKVFG